MASLEDAFTNQINTRASARNPNAYLANHQAGQQEPEWTQQFQNSMGNTSFEWEQQHNQQNGQQHPQQQEWLTPKQQHPQQQAINDAISPQQATEQIAHQHRFQPAELKLQPGEPSESHWWFIRARTGVEYCYPKRFNYRAGDD